MIYLFTDSLTREALLGIAQDLFNILKENSLFSRFTVGEDVLKTSFIVY